MMNLLLKPVSIAWLLLMLATGLSWWLGLDQGVDWKFGKISDFRFVSIGLILIAFIKVRIVIRYFMEIREAPLALRLICDVWLLLVSTTIMYLYYFGVSSTVTGT